MAVTRLRQTCRCRKFRQRPVRVDGGIINGIGGIRAADLIGTTHDINVSVHKPGRMPPQAHGQRDITGLPRPDAAVGIESGVKDLIGGCIVHNTA